MYRTRWASRVLHSQILRKKISGLWQPIFVLHLQTCNSKRLEVRCATQANKKNEMKLLWAQEITTVARIDHLLPVIPRINFDWARLATNSFVVYVIEEIIAAINCNRTYRRYCYLLLLARIWRTILVSCKRVLCQSVRTEVTRMTTIWR